MYENSYIVPRRPSQSEKNYTAFVKPESEERRRAFAIQLGERLRAARKALSATAEGVALAALVPRPRLSMWENGKALPDVLSLYRLTSALRVSADYLLGIDLDAMEAVFERAALVEAIGTKKLSRDQALQYAAGAGISREEVEDMFRTPSERYDLAVAEFRERGVMPPEASGEKGAHSLEEAWQAIALIQKSLDRMENRKTEDSSEQAPKPKPKGRRSA